MGSMSRSRISVRRTAVRHLAWLAPADPALSSGLSRTALASGCLGTAPGCERETFRYRARPGMSEDAEKELERCRIARQMLLP